MRTPTRAADVATTERACDLAWLHLVEAGLVSDRPDDLVTATLHTILREARERDARQPRRRWAA